MVAKVQAGQCFWYGHFEEGSIKLSLLDINVGSDFIKWPPASKLLNQKPKQILNFELEFDLSKDFVIWNSDTSDILEPLIETKLIGVIT